MVGELDEDKKWRRALADEPGYQYPVMFFRRRMRGTFTESLELKNFPVDVQVRKYFLVWCYIRDMFYVLFEVLRALEGGGWGW